MDFDKQVIERLMKCDWFSRCGEKGDSIPGVICDWIYDKDTAINLCEGIKWENVCIEEQNNITVFLNRNHRNEFKKWNPLVERIKADILPGVVERIRRSSNMQGVTDDVFNNVEGNIIDIVLASYYKELYTSPFFDSLLEIYCSGHLPCGWVGKWPRGAIRVY